MPKLELDPSIKELLANIAPTGPRAHSDDDLPVRDASILFACLERTLGDRDYLEVYLDCLDSLLPRPFPYCDSMKERLKQQVLTSGLGCLNARELVNLVVNPLELLDLRETILDQFPDYWEEIAHRAAKQAATETGVGRASDEFPHWLHQRLREVGQAQWREIREELSQLIGRALRPPESPAPGMHNEELSELIGQASKKPLEPPAPGIHNLVNAIFVRMHEDTSAPRLALRPFLETAAAEIRGHLYDLSPAQLSPSDSEYRVAFQTRSPDIETAGTYSAHPKNYPDVLAVSEDRWKALLSCNPDEAHVFLLFVFAGRSLEVIARLLSLEKDTATDLFNLALAYLYRESLEGACA